MYNEEKIVNSLAYITDTCFNELTIAEKLLVISNLILIESEQLLPEEIKKDAKNILSNGKRINYELLRYDSNLGLSLATMAHNIVLATNNYMDGNE